MDEKEKELDVETQEENNLEENIEDKDKKAKKEKHTKLKPKEQIEALNHEIYLLKEQLLRQVAEVENFKKRSSKEMIQLRKYASKNLIAEILQPLDQLNRIVHMSTEDQTLKNFLTGFKMINDQVYKVLEEDGLKPIDALHQKFDPNFHYAVEKTTDMNQENGINIEVIQTGYLYKDQLLRPAMVKVNEWSDENGEDK